MRRYPSFTRCAPCSRAPPRGSPHAPPRRSNWTSCRRFNERDGQSLGPRRLFDLNRHVSRGPPRRCAQPVSGEIGGSDPHNASDPWAIHNGIRRPGGRRYCGTCRGAVGPAVPRSGRGGKSDAHTYRSGPSRAASPVEGCDMSRLGFDRGRRRQCRSLRRHRSGRNRGAKVLILESAPKTYRGGNSRHTRNFRCMHQGPLSVLTDAYGEDEYFDDLLRVTKGKTDEALARMTIRSSEDCLPWMEAHGVRFQPSLSGTLSLSPHQCLLSGRRQGAGECLLQHRGGFRHNSALRGGSDPHPFG